MTTDAAPEVQTGGRETVMARSGEEHFSWLHGCLPRPAR